MTRALLLIAAFTLFSGTSWAIVQVSEESQEPQSVESREPEILQESLMPQSLESPESQQPSSIIQSQIIPFVRSGGTAIVPVRDAFRCKLLRLRDEDVVPREKIG